MSCIKELYLSANTLQSKFHLGDCEFIPTKEHSLSRRVLQGFAQRGEGEKENARGKEKKKKNHCILGPGKAFSKTFLFS